MKPNLMWLLLLFQVLWYGQIACARRFVAYSLKEAERRLIAGGDDPVVRELGYITDVAGLVYDGKTKDVIIVGQNNEGRPKMTLDDLIVAIRAVCVYNSAPLVSLDKTPETAKTNMQTVRCEGGIADTQLGKDMLEVDILLKKLALGKLPAEVWGVKSHFAMSVEAVKQGDDDRILSRFWVTNRTPALAGKDGVFAILRLELGVETEVLVAEIDGKPVKNLTGIRDVIGNQFAEQVAANLDDLSVQYPVLARARPILALVAIAGGIESLNVQDQLGFWLKRYPVRRVETPKEYPMIANRQQIERRQKVLTVSGGIKFNPVVFRLQNGEVAALKEAVLQSRPDPRSLVWRPPLDGWHIPGTEELKLDDLSDSDASGGKDGFVLERTVRPADSDALSPRSSILRKPLPPPDASLSDVRLTTTLPRQRYAQGIGGVMLAGTAQIEGTAQAEVNLTSGAFSLVVDGKNARIDPKLFRKFVTALWCVYYSDQDPGLSIDPIAPDVDKHLVRYIGRVINTDLARVMRGGDYTMKKWAVGTQRPNFKGFRDIDTWSYYQGNPTLASRRFWFVPEDLCFKRAGDLLLFHSGRMRLRTEFLAEGLRGQAAPSDEKFALFFTEHYDQIAEKYPIYKELFDYAKLVALAKYLKKHGVPLYWFLMAHKDLVLTEDSPGTVAQLAKGSEYFRGVTIQGGVNLGTESHYVLDSEAIVALNQALAAQRSSLSDRTTPTRQDRPAPPVRAVSFQSDHKGYTVLPQYTLTSGKDHRGIRYQTDLALQQNGRAGLELVRYYNPRNRDGGEFGKGWHLLIPYRVKPADDAKRKFLNAVIPQRMVVENLCTGQREVLTFSEDRYAVAGYVPEKLESSQIVGLFLMANTSYRLADKLGNQFHFDRAGYLTDMFLSPRPKHHVHVEYADDFTAAFTKSPYMVQPVDNERVAVRNLRVLKRIRVTDLLHGDSEVLTFNEKNEIPGYVPADKNASRFRVVALLTNNGLQLLDKHGNETRFDPRWRFKSMRPSGEQRMVRSIAMGGRKATFGYTIGPSGRVMIASASLSENKPGARPTHFVRYEHDDEGRLARVRLSGPSVADVRQPGSNDDLRIVSK